MGLDYTVHLGPYAEVPPGEYRLSPGDMSEVIKQALYFHKDRDGVVRWFPNVQREGQPRRFAHDPRHDGELYYEVTISGIVPEIVWFVGTFGVELRVLREAYGGLVVKWGLCSMVS